MISSSDEENHKAEFAQTRFILRSAMFLQDSQSRKLRVYDLTSDDFVAATLRREAENQAKNSDL